MVFSILYILLGTYHDSKDTLDINIHDTYYVIEYRHMYFIIGVFLAVLYFLHLLFSILKLRLPFRLLNIHIYATLISCLGISFPYHFFFDTDSLFPSTFNTNFYIKSFAVLLVLFQFLFFLSILISIFRILKVKFKNPAI